MSFIASAPFDFAASASEVADEIVLGNTRLHYAAQGSIASSLIQYTRVFITGGTVIDAIRSWVDQVGGGSPKARGALYTQTDPLSVAIGPSTRVAQSAEVTIVATGVLPLVFTSPYSIVEGYHWIAMAVSTAATKFPVSQNYREGFLPHRQEATTGTTMPATATPVTPPGANAVGYAAARVQ